jgi:NADH-quinone oxidoreductase subunit H
LSLFILAMSSMAVYAVVLAGWSSGSKYPLLGGVRATAQMISYEAAMGLALVPVVVLASALLGDGEGSGLGVMSLATLVDLQSGSFRGPIPGWFVFWLLRRS